MARKFSHALTQTGVFDPDTETYTGESNVKIGRDECCGHKPQNGGNYHKLKEEGTDW